MKYSAEQDDADHDRHRAREPRTRDAERDSGAPTRDQDRASSVFSSTVNAWIAIVGFTMPVPRSAEPIVTCAKPSAKPGKNQ